jgi:PadR family transcriptional regulator, regulatory protein PadR
MACGSIRRKKRIGVRLRFARRRRNLLLSARTEILRFASRPIRDYRFHSLDKEEYPPYDTHNLARGRRAMPTEREPGDLLQGTLGILILKSLMLGAAHGYAISRWIEEATDDVLRIEEGSLYPALRRLEDRAWVTSEWGLSENNRRARFYTITAAGRKHLRSEASVWLRYSQAVTRVLRAEPSVA